MSPIPNKSLDASWFSPRVQGKPAHQSSASEQVARIVDGGDGSFTVTQAADAAMATLHNEVLLHSSVLHLSTMLKSLTSGLFAENLIF